MESTVSGAARGHAKLDDWIAREAISFSLDSRASFNAAVGRLVAELGESVELLGLGEPLHGDGGFLLLRNRLFQRLVEAHGYRAIAVESSFTRGPLVNEYVLGRGGESYDEIQETGFSHGFGRMAANRELVEWMRAYNAEADHSVRLHFYGFDSPTEMMYADSPRQALEFVLGYLESLDRDGGRAQWERIEPLFREDALWENEEAAMDPTKSIGQSPAARELRIATEDLATELSIRRPDLVAKGGAGRYREAAHYVSIARQLLNYHARMAGTSDTRLVDLLGLRDVMMAENLAYVVEVERDRAALGTGQGGKVLAFAHNSHLKLGRAEWQWGPNFLAWWPAGSLLNAMIGRRYAVIGTGVGLSEPNGIAEPEAGTLEALLTAAPGPARLVPTHRGEGLVAVGIDGLPARTGSSINPTYFPLGPRGVSDFDWLAVLDAAD